MKRAALIAGVSIADSRCVPDRPKVSAAWHSATTSWWRQPTPAASSRADAGTKIRQAARQARRAKPTRRKARRQDAAGPDRACCTSSSRSTSSARRCSPTACRSRAPRFPPAPPSHPTPMGVFTIIQKSRHHVSNLYDAPMPYMQRITWSGSALHQGPLPGYPASHGCVRLTDELRATALEGDQDGRARHRHAPRRRADRVRARPAVRAEAEDGGGAAEAVASPSKLADAPRVPASAGRSGPASPSPKRPLRQPQPATHRGKVKTADAANATAVAVTSVVGDASKAGRHLGRDRAGGQCVRRRAADQACGHRRRRQRPETAAATASSR